MILIFGVIVLLAAASVQCSKIHERMTDGEIANLFRTTRDDVPEYEVALVRHNNYKRSDQTLRMQFTAFGKEVDVYLQPSDGQLFGENTPVWLASTMPNGTIEYKKMREGIVGIVASRFFGSSSDLSTVVVTQTKGENPAFNGIVGGMVVRSLPKSFQEEARSRRNSEAPRPSRTMLDSHYHVIIKSQSVTEQENIRRLEEQIREASRSANSTDASRVRRADREIIYPSLLIQTDYNVSKTQDDADHYQEILYQLAYWNAVDLRYRHIDDPKIRLRIAGIIIGQDRNAAPYLENHRSGGSVEMNQGFKKMEEYWFNMTEREDFPVEAFDIGVTLTDTDIMMGGQTIRGVAAFPSFCSEPWAHKFYAVALTHDNGGFDGILTSTHELGHVLGLDHDPDVDQNCNKSIGFIMAPKRIPTPKNLEWSPCSLKALSYFFRDDYINCYDTPADFYPPGNPVQRPLPGDLWGPHKQCQARGFAWACDPSPDMCKQMQCFHTTWQPFFVPGWRCENSGPAAEGTHCAPGHKCVDGICQCMTGECLYTN